MPRALFLSLVLTALAACAAPPQRFAVPQGADARPATPSGFARVELRAVSLPDYAETGEIARRDATGAVILDEGALWSDDPVRGLTLDLARDLGRASRAQVAAEPWPFDSFPDAAIELRVADMLAEETAGVFVLAGSWFVAARDGSGRDRAQDFRLTAPLPPEATPQDIAIARGQVTAALAREIAEDGLR